VNHSHLSRRDSDKLILDDFPLLEDLREHSGSETGVILVKANICEFLKSMLTRSGFTILNRGKKVPFPSTGNQTKFRNTVHPLLGL
jgi:hypothetical protein